jgi:hypothetical protein
VPKQIQVGSTVLVRLHDHREVEAKLTKIVDSVVGRKVHVAFGAFALIVGEVQIIREARPGLSPKQQIGTSVEGAVSAIWACAFVAIRRKCGLRRQN